MHGKCLYNKRQAREAGEFFALAMHMRSAELGSNHTSVATALVELGQCARDGGAQERGRGASGASRQAPAEGFFTQALAIWDAKPGSDDLAVAKAVFWLGRCALNGGRLEDAAVFFRREVEIMDAQIEPDKVFIANTLSCLGLSL
ncbi:unnamed protein product, partial [Laminaria digitata]